MRWLLAILFFASLVALVQSPPVPAPDCGLQPPKERQAVLWTFLSTRKFDPADWKLCLDTHRWVPPPSYDCDSFTPDLGRLTFPPYEWTESHGMALLVLYPKVWLDRYPDWPRHWLQFSPVGFSSDRKRARFTYFMVQPRGASDIVVQLGHAEVIRNGHSAWELVSFEERPVAPSAIQADKSEIRRLHTVVPPRP